MTDPAVDLSHSILLVVGDFLRKLPADQLTDLVSGEARLVVLPKGSRVTSSTPKAPSGQLSVSVADFRADLAKIDDRVAAVRYINDQKLTVAQIKQLCVALEIPIPSKATKADIVRTIVEVLVGGRLDADAIMRNSAAPRG